MRLGRLDLLAAAGLAAVTAASRMPFAVTRLWEWDSVLYARALENGFHVSAVVADQRPHPPGYIFYVAAGSLLHRTGLGSNEALVAVSVIASALGTALLYLLCIRVAPRPVAALVALAFAASPLVWLHGEVAHIYAVLACLSLALGLAFHVTWNGTRPRSLIAVSLLFGLLAGFRQDLLLYFAPLWIHSLLPLGWRQRAAAAAALAAACLVWLVPSALLSGGLGAYVGSVLTQSVDVANTSANGARSLETSVALLALSIGWGMLGSGLMLLGLLGARLLARRDPRRQGSTATFFALWLVPPAIFYVLVHVGEWGYALAIVPGLYALLAALAGSEWSRAARWHRAVLAALLMVAIGWSALAFTVGGDAVFSARAIADHDRMTAAKTGYILSRPAGPSHTVVLAGAELLVARYYLSGYTVLFSDARADRRYQRRLERESLVVVYEPSARPVDPPLVLLPSEQSAAAGLTIAVMPAGTDLVLGGTDLDARR